MNDVTSKGYIVRLTLTLFAITAIVALLLSFVNAQTKDTIAAKKAEELSAALSEVMTGADTPFSEPVYSDDSAVAYEALSGGKLIGWCIQVAPSGYGGPIELVVGVSADLQVTGVSIVSSNETVGLGSKADNPDWLSQFIGKSGTITVKSGENRIDAITGATVTSTAVTKGVNTALEIAAQMKGADAQ